MTFQPGRVEQLMQREPLSGIHLEAAVEKLQQLIGHIRIGQWELAADYMRFGPERIASKYGKIKRDTNGPDSGRLGLVKA